MIQVFINKQKVDYEQFTFNGGEESVKLSLQCHEKGDAVIKAILKSSTDVMRLLLITDALRQWSSGIKIDLWMPYIPYARQDRVCDRGEALSMKVFANLINSQNYHEVWTLDAHSDVAVALINNIRHSTMIEWLMFEGDEDTIQYKDELLEKIRTRKVTIVSPDAGALKKCFKISQYLGGELDLISADKIRDPKTGQIVRTEVNCPVNLKGRDMLIPDDICDGGRTFIELAKVLKARNAGKIYLAITHGIFSNGFEVFEGLIDKIYTTNSFYEGEPSDLVKVVDVFDYD